MEEALRLSGLMLVFDEAHFAWPMAMRPRGVPPRLQWLKTAFDSGTRSRSLRYPISQNGSNIMSRKRFGTLDNWTVGSIAKFVCPMVTHLMI